MTTAVKDKPAPPTRAKPGRKPQGESKIENILSLRGSLAFKDYVDRGVAFARSERQAANASDAIEKAIIRWLQEIGFDEKPPLR